MRGQRRPAPHAYLVLLACDPLSRLFPWRAALVTGGGGFLGRYIVEGLLGRGDSVRILARGEYPELAGRGVECVRGDLRDRAAVERAVRGVDCVFHAASHVAMWGDRRTFEAINVEGTRHVIDACRKHGVGRLVYTSSPSVVFGMGDLEGVDESRPYPRKFYAHYARTKAMAEREVLAANGPALATCALRPHLVWGPRDTHLIPTLMARAQSGQLVQIGDGTNRVDFTYVENAAVAHLLAADALAPGARAAGRAYFVSDDQPVELWRWIGRLLDALALPGARRRVSYRAAYGIASISEVVCTLLPFLGEPRLTRFLVANFGKSHYFDIRRAKADFGYRPVVDYEEGLKRTAAWFTRPATPGTGAISSPTPVTRTAPRRGSRCGS